MRFRVELVSLLFNGNITALVAHKIRALKKLDQKHLRPITMSTQIIKPTTGLFLFMAVYLILTTEAKSSSNEIPDFAAPGVASDKRVKFFVGQDSNSLREYKIAVLDKQPDFPKPSGISLYTNLVYGAFLAGMGMSPVDENGRLMPGFNYQTNHRYDFGGGPQSFTESMAMYPEADLNVGLYLSDIFAGCTNQPLRAIHAIENPAMGTDITKDLSAAYENAIDVMLTTMMSWDRQVYLRIGYEFDGVWNCYGSDLYKNAFRYISGRVKALDAKNIALVWQSSSWPRDEQVQNPQYNFIVSAEDHLEKWYPGDQYVDWIGLSTYFGKNYEDYQWSCNEKNPEYFTASLPPRDVQDRILDFARDRQKPVMIAEAAPQGLQTDTLTASCIFYRDERRVLPTNNLKMHAFKLWYLWFREWFNYIEENRDVVRAVAYINSDWDLIPQFECQKGVSAGSNGCNTGYWGDSRIQNNQVILNRFKRALEAPYWYSVETQSLAKSQE